MKFGFLSEAQTPIGVTHHRRYWEVIDEAILAEEMGWDFFGSSEQHFISPMACISAPETFYPAVAMRTSRIRFRHMVVLLPFPFNHPVRVAERLATLDIVSNGRAEIGTGRANTLLQLDGFQCPLDESRARWEEGLEILMKAFLHDPFSHEGRYFKIPPRSLCPKPVQQPHPPVSMVAQSPESNAVAGSKGIGSLCWDVYFGWDYMVQGYKAYKEAIAHANPIGGYINDSFAAVSLNVVCAETKAEAMKAAKVSIPNFAGPVIEEIYPALAKRSEAGYGYLKQLERIRAKSRDLDWLVNETSCIASDPDGFIERFKRYEELGANEIILRLDGTHEEIKRTITLIGRYVIPAFKTPKAVITRAQLEALAGPVP